MYASCNKTCWQISYNAQCVPKRLSAKYAVVMSISRKKDNTYFSVGKNISAKTEHESSQVKKRI